VEEPAPRAPCSLTFPRSFTLLVIVNAFVGAMVGMERSILPAIAERDFHLAARAAVLSFIVVFGLTAGYFAVAGAALATGWIAARYGLRLHLKEEIVAPATIRIASAPPRRAVRRTPRGPSIAPRARAAARARGSARGSPSPR
jgi:hypothetical protein